MLTESEAIEAFGNIFGSNRKGDAESKKTVTTQTVRRLSLQYEHNRKRKRGFYPREWKRHSNNTTRSRSSSRSKSRPRPSKAASRSRSRRSRSRPQSEAEKDSSCNSKREMLASSQQEAALSLNCKASHPAPQSFSDCKASSSNPSRLTFSFCKASSSGAAAQSFSVRTESSSQTFSFCKASSSHPTPQAFSVCEEANPHPVPQSSTFEPAPQSFPSRFSKTLNSDLATQSPSIDKAFTSHPAPRSSAVSPRFRKALNSDSATQSTLVDEASNLLPQPPSIESPEDCCEDRDQQISLFGEVKPFIAPRRRPSTQVVSAVKRVRKSQDSVRVARSLSAIPASDSRLVARKVCSSALWNRAQSALPLMAAENSTTGLVPNAIPAEEKIGATATISEFFAFVRERECIRIKREELGRLPPWSDDTVMQRIRLTNVRREMDKTTKTMRRITRAQANERWAGLTSSSELISSQLAQRQPWTRGQLELAGLIVFNCALWRAFGTLEFAEKLEFLEDWSPSVQNHTEEVALCLSRSGIPVFTQAYDPARSRRQQEMSRFGREDPSYVRRLIRSAFKSVSLVWEARQSIALKAFHTGSWCATTRRLMQVCGYGGTGFLAKEVVQDLMHTPLFQDFKVNSQSGAISWQSVCVDENNWCACGPGARRGLNRLAGRPLKYGIADCTPRAEEAFLRELKYVYSKRHDNDMWPSKLLGRDTQDLVLHDVQFQLCEFDKYLRAKHREGRVRPFVP